MNVLVRIYYYHPLFKLAAPFRFYIFIFVSLFSDVNQTLPLFFYQQNPLSTWHQLDALAV